jgi:MYXO-CTERM domain-containing protein
LNAALDAMEKDATDTDGDGVPDVEELRAGTDPDSPVPGATTADPKYGCGVASNPDRRGWPITLAFAIAALALRLRRRERRAVAAAQSACAPRCPAQATRRVSAGEARPSSACPRGRR